MFLNALQIIIMLIIAYLLGSIPSGMLIGKTFFNINLREHGSGNIGTTNTYRILGKRAGTIVMTMDISKGMLATLLPLFFHNFTLSPLIFGMMAILGHTFSIFDHFKGGKAVATSAGMLLAYSPILFLIAAGMWISFILITSVVSLASILAFILITIIIICTHDILLSILAIILTIFVIVKHRKNINRILNGTENMVPFGIGYLIKSHQKQKDES